MSLVTIFSNQKCTVSAKKNLFNVHRLLFLKQIFIVPYLAIVRPVRYNVLQWCVTLMHYAGALRCGWRYA